MELLEKVREIAERVAVSEGLELVEVEFLGRGPGAILRIFIDKPAPLTGSAPAAGTMAKEAAGQAGIGELDEAVAPGGVTVADCQNVSRQVGTILDVEDVIADSYTLEVSSPGLDRKLTKPADFERFAGSRVKVSLKRPRLEPQPLPRRFPGRLVGTEAGKIVVDTNVDGSNGPVVRLDFDEIERVNLAIEFGPAPKPHPGHKKTGKRRFKKR